MPTLTLPRPHPLQQHVIDGARRFNVVCCGRRWGKTELGMDRLIHTALRGKPAAWYAPSYKLAAPVWREMQNRLHPVTRDKSEQERRLELRGGGSVDVWSLDSPDSGRGRAYAAVVLDEAALIPNLESAWQESIRPQLTDHSGSAWFLSTPKGTASYFCRLWNKGADPDQPEWASWQMPSASNPYLPAGEIESARRDLGELAFAQEYLAQFVSWSGAVFRNITHAIIGSDPTVGAAVVLGVDWGRVNDHTVFVAIDGSGTVVGMDRFTGIAYSLQRNRLISFWRRMGGNAYILAENNNMGGPVVEQLQMDGLPVSAFTTTNASKAAIIEALALAFERGVIHIPPDPVLLGELQTYEAKPLPSGMMRYAAPEGSHDDTVMALAIAWSALGALERQRSRKRIWLDPASGLWSDMPPERYRISPI
ncbi:MAG: terminase large subunit domain-containing protein [Bryobacteraceae bacterium]